MAALKISERNSGAATILNLDGDLTGGGSAENSQKPVGVVRHNTVHAHFYEAAHLFLVIDREDVDAQVALVCCFYEVACQHAHNAGALGHL